MCHWLRDITLTSNVKERTDNEEMNDKNTGAEIAPLCCICFLVVCFCVIIGWLLKRATER